MPAQETVRASFFMRRDGGARRGLFAGRFVYGMVCLRDCLRDCLRGGLPAGRTVCGSGIFSRTRSGPEPGNRTGKQGNREAGNRGRKSGRLVVSGQWSVVSGQWLVVSGQWSVVGSVGQSAAGLQAGCFRGGANGLFCVRRNIYGGFLAPCAITRYIYKSELKKQTDR